MNKYTVVGLSIDDSRVAAWVEADSPEEAEAKVRQGGPSGIHEAWDSGGYGDDFILAGIFEGHIVAVDEQ